MPAWLVALAAGLLVLLTGWLPREAAADLASRTGPVLLFLVAITLVSELCAGAGLFDVLADRAARLARGRRPVLWLLVVTLATACTVVLSLDTTAVLVTPVVIALARRTRSDPLPFALTVLALANTASLLLPVSNLTNLLAADAMGDGYVGRMWAPALAVLAATVAGLALLHRRAIVGRYLPSEPQAPRDTIAVALAGAVVAAMAVCFAAELPVAPVALAGAAVLGVMTWWRRVPLLSRARDMVPWRAVVTVAGLFAVVEALHVHGLGAALAAVAGTADGGDGSLLRVAAVAAVAGNLVNNLPAFLALAPAAPDAPALGAVLVGVNAGPQLTVWASLATVLWLDQCRRRLFGVPVGWSVVLRQGAVLAPLTVLAGVAALALTA